MSFEPLQPQALDTAERESLSSYVQRLAAAHGTSVGQLLHRYFAWIERAQLDRVGEWVPHLGRIRSGFNINGFAHADAWVRAVQRFTGRADIVYLTTRSWDDLFPARGFLSATLDWCPYCLAEDAAPYHRLVWAIAPVRRCRKHQCSLQQRCASCDNRLPVLHERSHPITCPHCGGDLRVANVVPDVTDPGERDSWAANEVGRIIARASGNISPNWNPKRAIRGICRTLGVNGCALGPLLGTSKLTTWYWVEGKSRPTLGSALEVYYRAGMSLCGAIFGETEGQPTSGQQFNIRLRPARIQRRINWAEVHSALKTEIAAPCCEARPLKAVAGKLGIAVRTIRTHERQLCRIIARRHRIANLRAAAKRHRRLKAEIVAVLRRCGPGVILKWRDIETVMARPGLFNSNFARRALRDALTDVARCES